MKLLTLFFILYGCASYETLPQGYPIESEKQIIENFYSDCLKRRGDCNYTYEFKVNFVRRLAVGWDKSDAGYCDFLHKTIYINIREWELSTRTEKTLLLYHELGHCVLKIPFHRDGEVLRDNDKIPKSIMTGKELPTEEQFSNNREYYLDELFN